MHKIKYFSISVYTLGLMTLGLIMTLLLPHTYAADSTVDIREIKLRFCDETAGTTGMKQLFLETKPGVTEEICIDISNEGNAPVSLGINFVDGALTADTEQKKACLPEGERTNFGQYVSGYADYLEIPAKTTVRTVAHLTYPDGYAGDSYGCVTLHVTNQQQKTLEQDGQVFQVFSRLGYFIDAFVDGKFTIELLALPQTLERFTDKGNNPAFPIYEQDRKYATRAELYNTGNITVTGDITIGYSYWWLFGDKDELTAQSIVPKQSKLVEKEIPWYVTYIIGGPISTVVTMDYVPVYRGYTTQDNNGQMYSLYEKNNKFFIPRGLIVLLCIIMLICIIRKKAKKKKQKRLNKRTMSNSKKIHKKEQVEETSEEVIEEVAEEATSEGIKDESTSADKIDEERNDEFIDVTSEEENVK